MEKYQIGTNNNGDTVVTLHPSAIAEELKGKLSDADIMAGLSAVQKAYDSSFLYRELSSSCVNINCPSNSKSTFRVYPNGSYTAKVMIVNQKPTPYELYSQVSGSDKASVFLSLILSKMNVSRDDVYFTTLSKCDNGNDAESCQTCAKTYITREIVQVKPAVIVCNGLMTLKRLEFYGMLCGLPSETTYGMIYNVTVNLDASTQYPVKIMAIYELDKVLQKEGADYAKCKTTLWQQLLTAFKSA